MVNGITLLSATIFSGTTYAAVQTSFVPFHAAPGFTVALNALARVTEIELCNNCSLASKVTVTMSSSFAHCGSIGLFEVNVIFDNVGAVLS